MIENTKLVYTGIAANDQVARMARHSIWVGLGTFGLSGGAHFLQYLPRNSHIIVGLPDDDSGKVTHTLDGLRVVKKKYPHLIIAARRDFHAKYALFKTSKNNWVMLGSANLTRSPQFETVLLFSSTEIYKELAAKHEFWLGGRDSIVIEPNPAPPMSPQQLKALLSTPVK